MRILFILTYTNQASWNVYIFFSQQNTDTYDGKKRMDNQIKDVEKSWGIVVAATKEWGSTFDNFLKVQNTPDLTTATRLMCCHKGNGRDTSQHKKKKVNVKLLENWLKPRLEPHPWKYRLGKIFKKWGDEYEKEVEHSKRTSKALFGADGDTASHLTATHLTHTWISRDEFIQGVINEIRLGKTEVICSNVMFYILACKSILKGLLFVIGDRFTEKPLPKI